jgi:COP9 signalosome complex subunit 4
MSTERLIPAADAAAFGAALPEHMRATDAEGVTVFAKAFTEHNVLAASRVYANITFDALGGLMGVDARRAERVAAKMVNERRLAATIDQVDGVLDFAPGGARATPDAAVAEILGLDAAVRDVTLSLNDLVEGIGALGGPAGARAGAV